ncbi:MAG: MBL fold metallo-hydrolase [Oscillibacter sp.]|nr:MBL fold metallo-hydrolase [Oscillibacter sp.]
MDVQCLQVGMIETNCYLLCDTETRKCAVIDPGDEAGRIAVAVRKSGCAPTAILLTHGHYDHTEGVAELRRAFPGLPVYLNREDTPAAGAPASLFPPVPDTVPYGEGDKVSVGNLTVSVIATPGHTKGSVSLICGDALFSGDTLFAGDCGRTDLWGGDMEQMLYSLGRLGSLGGNFKVYPGHMEASTLERERAWNPWVKQGMRMLQSAKEA